MPSDYLDDSAIWSDPTVTSRTYLKSSLSWESPMGNDEYLDSSPGWSTPGRRIIISPDHMYSVRAYASFILKAFWSDDLSKVESPVWKSDDERVATVSQTGTVTCMSAGETRVSASKDGKVGYAKVTVTEAEPCQFVINPSSVQVRLGSSKKLSTSPVQPDATWESNKPKAVTVEGSSDGTATVTMVTGSEATITATSGVYTATCSVTPLPVGT